LFPADSCNKSENTLVKARKKRINEPDMALSRAPKPLTAGDLVQNSRHVPIRAGCQFEETLTIFAKRCPLPVRVEENRAYQFFRQRPRLPGEKGIRDS
jgi:hypothetical protein